MRLGTKTAGRLELRVASKEQRIGFHLVAHLVGNAASAVSFFA